MTHKKKTYGHQLGPMTHFLTTPKFGLLLYIGEKCGKNPYFYHFLWEKEVKLERNQKKIALCGLRWFKLNVSKCQKDVKLSKKCQVVKKMSNVKNSNT